MVQLEHKLPIILFFHFAGSRKNIPAGRRNLACYEINSKAREAK